MIFRLRDFIRHPVRIYKFRKFLEESQFWPPERLEKWRLERLRRTISHAFSNVPYYRDMAAELGISSEDIKTFDDLRKLPLLSREDVVDNFDRLKADNIQKFEPLLSHTSGSTGTAMRFYLDMHTNVLEFASLWRVLSWTGYRFGQKYANLHGRVTKDHRLWEYDWRLNCLHLSSFNFKKKNIPLYVEKLRKFKPVLIKAYPSSMSLFARWIEELGIEPYRPKAVVCSSETLLDHHRDVIKRVFDCPVHDFYGQNERAALISTCPMGRYHIHQEYSHVEILDENGNPAQPGRAGEIVTTSFHNFAMPLIRYRTRDLAIPSAEKCPCGRPYPVVERIIGRIEDIIVTPDGRHVGRMDAAFKYSKGIRMSQIVQEDVSSLTVKIVRGEGYDSEQERILIKEMRDRLGDEIDINIEYVDDIPAGINGKIRFVVSKVAPSIQINKGIDIEKASLVHPT